MLKLISCFTLLIITIVAANYDFHDPDFNGLLFEDLTMAIEDKPQRFRRDTDNVSTDCHREKPIKEEKDIHCCSGEKGNPEGLKVAKEVKKKCFAEIRGESGTDDELSFDPLSCESIQAMREKTVCAAECIAKKLDLLNASGEFKRDALLNHTRKLIGESKWKAANLENYIDGCLDSLKLNLKDDVKKSDKATCNPAPLEYHHCIWKKLVESCPVESQIDSKKCRKIRERLTKGDTSYANKTFKKLFKH